MHKELIIDDVSAILKSLFDKLKEPSLHCICMYVAFTYIFRWGMEGFVFHYIFNRRGEYRRRVIPRGIIVGEFGDVYVPVNMKIKQVNKTLN